MEIVLEPVCVNKYKKNEGKYEPSTKQME